MKAILLKCVIPVLAAIASCNPAIAALYSIGPSSSVTLSGTVNLEITSSLSATKITGSGNIAEQGPGSLTSTLFGFINANASGTGLTFPGGSSIVALPSGTWAPQNAPASFGFVLAIPLSAPGLGDLGTIRFLGDLRDLAFDLSGNAALTGNTFNPQGLALISKSGIIDMHGFVCSGAETDLTKCDDAGLTSSGADDGQGPDLLPSGTGSFDGKNLSFSLAISDPGNETQDTSVVVNGVTVPLHIVLTGSFNVAGNVIAAAIPEPSAWIALCCGLLGFAVVRHTRRA